MEINEKAKMHEVKHILTGISGSRHFFEVISGESGEKYEVKLELSCTCRYMSVQGIPNGRVCSHIISVINKISKTMSVINKINKEGGIKQ